jgi:hypothetical protein
MQSAMSEGRLTNLSVFPVQNRADHSISVKLAKILQTSGHENLSLFFLSGSYKNIYLASNGRHSDK